MAMFEAGYLCTASLQFIRSDAAERLVPCLVTGHPDGALDGVYKLAFSNNQPRLKLSETSVKISLPYKKQVYRLLDSNGLFFGADVIALDEEKKIDVMYYPFEAHLPISIKQYKKEKLLHKVMENGKRLTKSKSIKEIARYSQMRLGQLPGVK